MSSQVYVPPYKLKLATKEMAKEKSSIAYQRLTWDALRKSINGLLNKVSAANIKHIISELFSENLIRGRGLFCRFCIKSQTASPALTPVFASLVSAINAKFPQVGALLLRRIIGRLLRAYERKDDKPRLVAALKFTAHLVNQGVVDELIALELLVLLLQNPTVDSVEVAVGFVKECGSLLLEVCPSILQRRVFDRFREILHEGEEVDRRVAFLIEGLFALRRAGFEGYPAVTPELDLVEEEDQLTHQLSLLDKMDGESGLDIFRPDPLFVQSENDYDQLKKQILGEDEDEDEDEDEESNSIKDETGTDMVNLRRNIYLTVMSSLTYEGAGHKLLKMMKVKGGEEKELCVMLLECCSEERTYLPYYGCICATLCRIGRSYRESFLKCFVDQYSMVHRLETNKLCIVAKFFAHLLGTDALPWHLLGHIRLTREDTTSSSRIFVKCLFQELHDVHLGTTRLLQRLTHPAIQRSLESSIFPKDNPRNTSFAINFFTSIGLGGITENLRECLKETKMKMKRSSSSSDHSDERRGKKRRGESDKRRGNKRREDDNNRHH